MRYAWSAFAASVAFALACVPGASAESAPTPAAAALTGAMAGYAWFPGRWACRTAAAGSPSADTPGKLWVVVDAPHDALKEYFAMTPAAGSEYRSDDVLSYDADLHAYVRHTIDNHKTQAVLAAKAPYKPTMAFEGFLGPPGGKIYRMRATVSIDAAKTELTTETAFWHADTKAWVVQSTTACAKI